MAVDDCGLVCKYILIIFNIIFALLGIAFLGLGLWLRLSESTRVIFEFEILNSGTFVTAVTILITLGAVMLIVSAFGDYGACNEKSCGLVMYSILLSILLIAEVSVGVFSYTNWDVVGRKIVEFYNSLYTMYVTNGGDPVLAVTLTFIHSTLHCCGVTGVSLVELAKATCPKPSGFLEHIKMDSCPGIIITAFESKASLVLGIFLSTAVLLIIALICSAMLSNKIGQSSSSPQYIILTQSISTNPQPAQHEFVCTSQPNIDQEPVVFTPLSVANIPATHS